MIEAGIYFKNVGQGDSIILQAEYKARIYIGIIDCKKHLKKNPVVEHLEQLKDRDYVIEFVIISHFHRDHYSGIIGLLEYLQKTNKVIKHFYDTFTFQNLINITYLPKNFINRISSFSEILEGIILGKTGKLFNSHSFFNSGFKLQFELDDICIETFSPSLEEFRIFSKRLMENKKNEESHILTKIDANIFSAISIVSYAKNKNFIFLTSDGEKTAFKRMNSIFFTGEENRNFTFKNRYRTLVAAQIPHHGSRHSFYYDFWKNLMDSVSHESKPVAIFSVNKNKKKHPHKDVVEQIEGLEYAIQHTYNISNKFDEIMNDLDLISRHTKNAKK